MRFFVIIEGEVSREWGKLFEKDVIIAGLVLLVYREMNAADAQARGIIWHLSPSLSQ